MVCNVDLDIIAKKKSSVGKIKANDRKFLDSNSISVLVYTTNYTRSTRSTRSTSGTRITSSNSSNNTTITTTPCTKKCKRNDAGWQSLNGLQSRPKHNCQEDIISRQNKHKVTESP